MRRILLAMLFASGSVLAQQTVHVAPVPQPGDPNYISYQMNQLGEILRRNQIHAAQLEALNAQAELARTAAQSLKPSEVENLLNLAKLLDAAGTPEQKQALQVVIQQKLDHLLPVGLRAYPPGTVLVFATPGFPWAAQQVAGVLAGKPVALDTSLAEVRAIASSNPNVVGIVEVEVNVYQAYETVKANCLRTDGAKVWSKKTLFNMGGSPEQLARDMVGKLLGKVKGQACP
jgi:hypothetical protein